MSITNGNVKNKTQRTSSENTKLSNKAIMTSHTGNFIMDALCS